MPRPFELPLPVPLAEQRGQSYTHLVALMERLLAEDGCAWDREQTPETLRRYVLEEACEVLDAIDSGRPEALAEELGDLAFQVVFLAAVARRRGWFGPDDVLRGVVEKLVRRHPHVFDPDAEELSREAIARRYRELKQAERGWRPLLGSVPRATPALPRAQAMSQTVAAVGFDWPSVEGSREKLTEELGELDRAMSGGDRAEVEQELGDVLFAVVNLARHLGVDAERALGKTCDKFEARFAHVERRALSVHGDWPRDARGAPTGGLSLAELDGYWDEAKQEERRG